jgi:ADP-ribose pyrophosphatase
MPLPPLPKLALSVDEDLSPPQPAGFLRLLRHRLRLWVGDAPASDATVVDSIGRAALDAVVIAPFHIDETGVRWVWLRSSLRPALAMRPMEARPFDEKPSLGVLWELPAGLVEPDEISVAGLVRCAARELEEELGFDVALDRFAPLGPSNFPLAGAIAERHHYFCVEVDPASRHQPSEDGSVLERDALVVALPLDEALTLLRAGVIEDAKSEIGLRRLAEAMP